MSTRMVEVVECTCEASECGHIWVPRLQNGKLPKQCPLCTYRGWNKSEDDVSADKGKKLPTGKWGLPIIDRYDIG
jgi:hypothetical protein